MFDDSSDFNSIDELTDKYSVPLTCTNDDGSYYYLVVENLEEVFEDIRVTLRTRFITTPIFGYD
jgi:hypothetical protein